MFDRKFLLAITVSIMLVLIVTACRPSRSQNETVVASVTATSQDSFTTTPTKMATATLLPSLTPSPEVTPSATGIRVTPTFPEILESDFFFGGQSPDCELPCWRGLGVNDSALDDVQLLFDTTFGFDGTISVLELDTPDWLQAQPSAMVSVVQTWGLDDDTTDPIFIVRFWLAEDTFILKHLSFQFYRILDTDMSPYRVFQELGTPADMRVSVERTERADIGSLRLLITYNEGMVFTYDLSVPIRITGTATEWSEIVSLCFDQDEGGHFISILEPFINGLRDMTPLQDQIVGTQIADWNLVPIEEFFGVSIDDLMRSIAQDKSTCLSKDIRN